MKHKVYSVGTRQQSPNDWLKKAQPYLFLLLAGGIVGGFAVDRAFIPKEKAQAEVTSEVEFHFFSGDGKNRPHNTMELRLVSGERSGQSGKAYFYFKSSAQDFKEGEVLDVSYQVRRLSGKVIVSDLKKKTETIDDEPRFGAPSKPSL